MLLYGAGGHAKVILSGCLSQKMRIDAIFDDFETSGEILQIKVTGKYDPHTCPKEEIIIAIGNNLIRRKIAGRILHCPGTIIHQTAYVENTASVGAGTVVLQRAILQSDVTLGKHVIVNTGAIIEHDCRIEDFVHIAPGVVICGNVEVLENTLIGAGSIITPNLHIGANCIIAAGSLITKNIPDYAVVRGNPGRIVKIGRNNA